MNPQFVPQPRLGGPVRIQLIPLGGVEFANGVYEFGLQRVNLLVQFTQLLAEFPNLVVLRTFSKCYGLAGLRVGYAIGSAKFRAAVDAVRQPFSVNALAQAAGAEAVLHSDDVDTGGGAFVAWLVGMVALLALAVLALARSLPHLRDEGL